MSSATTITHMHRMLLLSVLLGLSFSVRTQVPSFGIPYIDPEVLRPFAPDDLIRLGRDLEMIDAEGSTRENRFRLRHLPDSMVEVSATYWNAKKPIRYYYIARNGSYRRCSRRGKLHRSWKDEYPAPWVFQQTDSTYVGDTLNVRRIWSGGDTNAEETTSWVGGRLQWRHYQEVGAWEQYTKYVYSGPGSIACMDSANGPLGSDFFVERTEFDLRYNNSGQLERVIKLRQASGSLEAYVLSYRLEYENGTCVVQEMTTHKGETIRTRLRFL